ncbi:hypothetical protein BCR35DRAFT_336038 [Leucosporidium creatinivorum]|uniref:DUF7704 domain-containing protein n=1 Tax=Leucosporidium creatinivorum TaxID=106004 RepID=A0A1Y2CV31_9BASI|nr:hypothetical protein BCR35DRAFT_336038 [Leucosporidium creatinivorum]
MLDPYPKLYRLIFGLLEPAGLLGGAAFAILFPNQFHHAYLGSGWLGDASRGSQAGQKGVLVASGMGTCRLIIGVMSSVLLPTFQKTLKGQPQLHETLLRSYLGCLLIGDFAHTFVTLYYTPADVRWHPFSRWTLLLWGNIAGTIFPNFARLAWFAGIGRRGRAVQL